MGIREEFTDEEWQTLLSVPYAVSLTIVTAAPSLWGAFGESKTMLTEPAKLAASSGSDLVGILSSEMQSRAKELIKQQQDLFKHDKSGFRSKTIEACTSASEILSKTTPEEAMAYKKWVLAIGQKVAAAAKESGVAVSAPETAVLNEISGAFGMGS
ncbi:MAG: hypothetical protein LUP95_07100 [Euryarchaeota archaeon]|nr:hypothetical protein [Euryarchaeota archaeon]